MGTTWGILRALGIAVGIFAMWRLARIGFNVEFNDVFQAFLDRMRKFFELDAVIDVIEEWCVVPTLTWLRGFGWTIPHPGDHWRPVFTLEWLLLAAAARNLPGNIAVQIAWAFVCALLAAVAAGTQPPTTWAVVLWPIAALLLFGAGLLGKFGATGLALGAAALFAAVGVFDTTPTKASLGFVNNSPALLNLVGLVGFIGLGMLMVGLTNGGTWRERLTDPSTAIGLDIVAVMGGAFGIGYLMLK
jgi:hypothetical protein